MPAMVEEQQRLGRYELLAEIGRGAMGVVYKARDPIIDRVLAIKTVDFRGLGAVQPGVQARFFQEAQSAGRLSHPNIVTIFDAGEADGCAYIAMELLEGPSLREVLDQSAPLSVTRALEIAGQITRGLAYAHEHGVVHRDVKPANVILVARRVKITDFGIARLPFGASNAQSELAGSPKYMSPEQALGENVDGRSDLFALGTVLYEMLTGKQPFLGESVPQIMQAVLLHEPPPPSMLNPLVPPAVDAFVRRVLSKQPEARPPSARALLRDLAALLKEIGGSHGRASRSEHRHRSRRVVSEGDATVLLPSVEKKSRRGAGLRIARHWWYGVAAMLIAGVLTTVALKTYRVSPAVAVLTESAQASPETLLAVAATDGADAPFEVAREREDGGNAATDVKPKNLKSKKSSARVKTAGAARQTSPAQPAAAVVATA
ncbi:MAG TPA: serine/threonine-protein kinase, partial [Burkholderiales bacterium]